MKKNLIVPAAAVVLGLVLFGIVFILDEQLPAGGVGLCAGLGGALIGLGGGSLFLPLAMAAMKPEDRREVERAERMSGALPSAPTPPMTAGTGRCGCCGSPLWWLWCVETSPGW